jgi:hypothetical protein
MPAQVAKGSKSWVDQRAMVQRSKSPYLIFSFSDLLCKHLLEPGSLCMPISIVSFTFSGRWHNCWDGKEIWSKEMVNHCSSFARTYRKAVSGTVWHEPLISSILHLNFYPCKYNTYDIILNNWTLTVDSCSIALLFASPVLWIYKTRE